MTSPTRYVVTVSRSEATDDPLVSSLQVAVVGPFQSERRADERAGTIRKLAEKYEDAIDVVVEPILPGASSAQYALDVLYGTVDP